MSQTFNVYEADRLIAVVHAENAPQAILAACTKTDGNDPKLCMARPVQMKPAIRTLGVA